MSRHFNGQQYLLDLLSVTKEPDQRALIKTLLDTVHTKEFSDADTKYNCRRYPDKDLSFYMTGRGSEYLMTLSGDAFKILHYMAQFMSQDNLCIAPQETISDILDIPMRNVQRAFNQLKKTGAIINTGHKYKSCPIYEIDQSYVSYGARPVNHKVIKGQKSTYAPYVYKMMIESNDPENPKKLYIGELQRIVPKVVRGENVVDFEKPKPKSDIPPAPMTQLLEGLI